jgi:hypothetical protein
MRIMRVRAHVCEENHKPTKHPIKCRKTTASGIVLSIPEAIILKNYMFFSNFKRYLTRVRYGSVCCPVFVDVFLR